MSKGLSFLDVIDEDDAKKLEEELKTNDYLQDEVISLSKSIAPWIPYIGLTLAGISIGKYAYTRYLRHRQNAEDTPNPEGNLNKLNDAQSERASSSGVVPNPILTVLDDNRQE